MIETWAIGMFLVGLALGFGLLAVVVKRGWFTIGLAAKDATEQMAFLLEGLHIVRGKKSAPCPKCGFRFGTGTDPAPDERREGVI